MKKPIAGLFFTLLFCLAAGILYAGGPEGILSEAIRGFTGDHVVGEPIVAGEVVIIPSCSADFSFGEISGGPDGEVWGSGASGKLNFLPYAIAIVDQKGVRVLPVSNKKTFFEQVVEALPKLMPIVQQVIGYFSLNSGSAALEMPKTGSEQIIDVETLQPTDRVAELYHRVQLGLPPEDYQEILAEARELLPEDPGNAKLHSVNAYATMMMIQKAGPLQQIRMALEAQKEIDTALSLDPNDILGLISQGWMNLHNPMGRIDLAEAAFEKVLSIDPEHLEALMGLTMVYEKMGRSEKVKEWAEKGLALDPENEYFLNLIH